MSTAIGLIDLTQDSIITCACQRGSAKTEESRWERSRFLATDERRHALNHRRSQPEPMTAEPGTEKHTPEHGHGADVRVVTRDHGVRGLPQHGKKSP